LTLEGPGDRVEVATRLIGLLRRRAEAGEPIAAGDLRYLVTKAVKQPEVLDADPAPVFITTHSGRRITAKTHNQRAYLDALVRNPVVVALGPAGTGKTFLAVAAAVIALRDRRVSRIVLSRPTIEAGERLGYLPGDMLEKVDPYFRPLYDALIEFLGASRFQQLLDKGTIEITPLAYMRGRTFNEAFMILDEAQNTTIPQLKMFLTRMGQGTQVVVTGDPTQVDLPDPGESALVTLPHILEQVRGIEFVNLGREDVVRHEMVQAIVEAYARFFSHEDRK